MRYCRSKIAANGTELGKSGEAGAMRVPHWIVAAAVAASPALAAPSSPFARETAVWNAVRDKNLDVFSASMAPSFVGVYAFGLHDRAQEIGVVRNQTLRSFVLCNFHARMIDPNDMLMTYTADVVGTEDNKSFSGRYWNTSLWHRSSGKWLTVYHGEVKAR
jgi:hypothetical protein